MIEFFPIKIESVTDWSLIFALVAGIAFFFGKLINEVSPYKESKYAIYVSGASYLILFVIFPPLILYTIFEAHFFKIPYVWALVLHFLLAWYLGQRLNSYQAQRMKLDATVRNLTLEKSQQIINKNKILKKFANLDQAKSGLDTVYFKKMPQWLLLLFAILNYWFAASVLFSGAKPILMFLSLLFLLVSMSCLAVFYAHANSKYPQVTVHLDSGEKLEGELTKIDEGFINIIGNNRVYHIIDSKVKYIEVEIMTKQGMKTIKKKILNKK
ncbi:MAG: hypothetical protein AABX47_02325 [Nanoarchaeota archaeon]